VEGDVLCTTCMQQYGLGKAQECFACRLPSPLGRTCERCRNNTRLSAVAVSAYYDGPVKELVWRLKYHRLQAAAEPAAELICRALPAWPIDRITSVPIAGPRYRERGYNQAELIARGLARRLGLPYAPLLGRHDARHQVGLGRQDRQQQVQKAFYGTRRLHGERVLIVDDVITTGATLAACAAVLRDAGAQAVSGAAIARH
jgi:competence protein ComFC